MSPELKKRLITAGILILLVAVIGTVLAQLQWGRKALITIICILAGIASFEFSNVVSKDLVRKALYGLLLFVPLFATSVVFWDLPEPSMATRWTITILMIALIIVPLVAIILGRNSEENARTVSLDLFVGIIGIYLGFLCLLNLAINPKSFIFLLTLLLIVCTVDSVAYFVGTKYSGEKIASYISPKKTIHGTVAGLLVGSIVGAIVFTILTPGNFTESLLIAVAIAVTGQIGDFLVSFLKRIHNAKDAGSIFPGHGGLLDRMDSILLASVVMYLYTLYL